MCDHLSHALESNCIHLDYEFDVKRFIGKQTNIQDYNKNNRRSVMNSHASIFGF